MMTIDDYNTLTTYLHGLAHGILVGGLIAVVLIVWLL